MHVTNREEPWEARVERWLDYDRPTRQQTVATQALVACKPEIDALPTPMGAWVASEWLGVMEVQLYADDELVDA
jgi:hypothetical protein